MAQVHRFRNRVALYVGNGETVYMTPLEAKRFASALNGAARDIRQFPNFSESEFRTREFVLSDPQFKKGTNQ